jgi:ABC-2 type transport system permease protein
VTGGVASARGTAGGAVYDRGYRPYEGKRGGQRSATLALYRASMRRALGLRRSWRQKLFPWVLLAIVTIPAAVNVGIAYVTRDSPVEDFTFITYREYVGVSSALLLFVALTAPDIICPDRRQRVLPLIFARPLTGRDYVTAKLGAMFTILFAFGFLPQVVLFVGQMLVSTDGSLHYLRDNADVLWKVPIAVAALAAYYSAFGLAISAFTTRRIVAGASFIGVLLISSAVAGILVESKDGTNGQGAAALFNLLGIPLYVRDLVFLGRIEPFDSPLSGVSHGGLYALLIWAAVVLGSTAVLLRRYRWVEA